ncbi:MAG: hypothetical protein ACOCVR_02565 [Myxococcota bacterium]
MDEQHRGVVHVVDGVRRVRVGRVVLQIDAGEAPLLLGKYLPLVVLPVLAGLKEDAVEPGVAHLLRLYLEDVVGPGEVPSSPPVAFRSSGLHGQQKIVSCLGKIEEVAAVYVPSQNTHAARNSREELE